MHPPLAERSRHDVLVIGAGSAGCVLASRLSEDPACTVALIEAGSWPDDPDIRDPLKWPELQGRSYDWGYRTAPDTGTAGRTHLWPRGRLVGGSSCLHAMAHVRGHPEDFESWRAHGGERWSYEALLPYYIRSERFDGAAGATDDNRGRDGPIAVHLPEAELSPLARDYIDACRGLGVPALSDHNGGELVGACPNSLTIANGERVGAADAYLSADVLARPNLTLSSGTEVERLVLSRSRVEAVIAFRGTQRQLLEGTTIVLSSGAIGTPLLLMRSGIGDPVTLAKAAIDCVHPLAGVGCELQDHLLGLGNVYRSRRAVPPSRLQHSEALTYLHGADLTRAVGRPDLVVGCAIAPLAPPGFDVPAYGEGYTLLFGVTAPTSRGRILPGGPTRHDTPRIEANYLATGHDRHTMRAALETARAIGRQPALGRWRRAEVLPGEHVTSHAELDAFCAATASTHHHPCGTCAMGTHERAVVDPELRLHGLDNLHIVDASVFPSITSGPINATVVALAESWADRTGSGGVC